MILPVWLLVANLVVLLVWSHVVVWRIWSHTDRSVPYVDFCAVAAAPLSRNWGGAYQWPGTYDPDVVRYWRDRAMRAWLLVMFGAALQIGVAALTAHLVLPHLYPAAM